MLGLDQRRYVRYTSVETITLPLRNDRLRPDTQTEAKQGCIPNVALRWRQVANQVINLGDTSVLTIFRKLMKNDDGATAIEYVLIASLISVAAIAAMTKVGGKVSNVLSNVANAMN
jgi:pilus assembly protein Flp/PilA